MLLRTIGIGATETFQTNYLGTYLLVLGPALTGNIVVKVVPMGDGVLVDLDEDGVDAVGRWKILGADGSDARRLIPLSDGLVANKVVDITITNGAAATINVYMPVMGRGTMYVQSIQQTILANSQAVFKDFSALFLEAMTLENGQITVDWRDGSSHTFSPSELRIMVSYDQQVVYNLLENLSAKVRKVTIIPTADLKVQLTRYRKIGAL